jgi:hypothetical protein
MKDGCSLLNYQSSKFLLETIVMLCENRATILVSMSRIVVEVVPENGDLILCSVPRVLVF